MAPNWVLCSLLLLLTALFSAHTVAGSGKCTEEDLMISQSQMSRGHPSRWKLEVRSKCAACEASLVELRCPGWVEGKAIEGYMYPVELVAPDLCMLGASITVHQPFSAVYHQPAGKIDLTVASARFSCSSSSSSSTPQP